jgi:hypothetical protein
VAASADSVAAGWPANSVAVNFAAAANFVVVDSVIATSGAAASDSASVTTMTTTPPVTRMDMGTRMDMAVAITRTPTAMRTKTTAVATWFGDACTPRMAGTCNSVRCLPTSALSRAEVTGDFGGSLMRQSSKVRSTRRRDCGDYQAAAWTTCSAWTRVIGGAPDRIADLADLAFAFRGVADVPATYVRHFHNQSCNDRTKCQHQIPVAGLGVLDGSVVKKP